MGGNLIESQRAVIALFWPAGARADGTATLVNITSRRLNIPNATFALHRIKLKSKLIFSPPPHFRYYWPGANTFPGFISHHLAFLPVCAYFGF